MVGWHHQLDGHEFGQALGVGDGQGGLACPWFMGSQRVRHDWLNWTELNWYIYFFFSCVLCCTLYMWAILEQVFGGSGKKVPYNILKSHDEKLSRTKGKYMKTYLQKYLLKLKIKGKGRYTKENLQNKVTLGSWPLI